ncbi:MAG: acyl-CoA thioesterase [Spirochaetia bacterium]|nr:acyl-CoA thioesterase [Spirochaetia bacterium]
MQEIKATPIKVRYAETDQMGIVHHSVYAIWFEACRTDYMEQLGYPYSRMEEEGIITPLVKLECTFREGARYGDTVLVSAKLKSLSYVKLEITYEVRREADGHLLAEGSTTLGCADRNLHIINLKKVNPALYARLEGQLEK